MIPKIIHYCWFGGNPLPKSAIKCINSWKKFFPDYEIKEWNEENFDITLMSYTKEAYLAKKYAFVSDVARFWILYHEGGVYFDTDVEVIRPMQDILIQGGFMGVETPSDGINVPTVNSGLGLAAPKGHPFLKEVIEFYQNSHYGNPETGEKTIEGTVVTHVTNLLVPHGLKPVNDVQRVADINIYPRDYFCPFEDSTGVLTKTMNTRSIHWYSKTWIEMPRIYYHITRLLHRVFGVDVFHKL